MGRIGLSELIPIALIALFLFGAGRLGDIGRGLGVGIKNLKKGIKDLEPNASDEPKGSSEPSDKKAN